MAKAFAEDLQRRAEQSAAAIALPIQDALMPHARKWHAYLAAALCVATGIVLVICHSANGALWSVGWFNIALGVLGLLLLLACPMIARQAPGSWMGRCLTKCGLALLTAVLTTACLCAAAYGMILEPGNASVEAGWGWTIVAIAGLIAGYAVVYLFAPERACIQSPSTLDTFFTPPGDGDDADA
jgi:hypothetical protein